MIDEIKMQKNNNHSFQDPTGILNLLLAAETNFFSEG
jgi:hypothetical protein